MRDHSFKKSNLLFLSPICSTSLWSLRTQKVWEDWHFSVLPKKVAQGRQELIMDSLGRKLKDTHDLELLSNPSCLDNQTKVPWPIAMNCDESLMDGWVPYVPLEVLP